jgi:hypothetical protein
MPGVTLSPAASGLLPAAAAAAKAVVEQMAQQQQQLLPPSGLQAGLVSPDRLLLMPDAATAAAAAAAAAAGLSSGPPRVKRTAKRTGMPRCFSSKNIAGGMYVCSSLSFLYGSVSAGNTDAPSVECVDACLGCNL